MGAKGCSGTLVLRPDGTTLITGTIAAGGEHSCSFANDLGILCWGSDSTQELGAGGDGGAFLNTAVVAVVPTGGQPYTPPYAMGLGTGHTCAIADSPGAIALGCWGDDSSAQLDGVAGQGPSATPRAPTGYSTLTLAGQTIGAGFAHTCAIAADKSIWCWGSDADGELGDGDAGSAPTPRQLPLGTGYTVIASSSRHTCAYNGNDKVYCWGANDQLELGSADSTTHGPVEVCWP
jgi:alpha-tubulin suppressor-like RCC1 family protein